MNIKELLEYGKINLIEKEDPIRLSKTLLKYMLKVDNTYILINDKEEIEESIALEYKENIKLLNSGIPLQYIIKNQEFMGINFYVNENVLIPQPDTEILVEEILNICKDKENLNILDLCTGSGAIGIALAKYLKNAKVTLLDISEGALKVAKENAINTNVYETCSFIQSDMFEKIDEKFDLIVSNPPYIETEVIKTLEKEVQNEPNIALDGGEDGLFFYKIISENAYRYLNDNGILALEIGYNQKEKVIELLKKTNEYKGIYTKLDLSGNDRIIVAERRN